MNRLAIFFAALGLSAGVRAEFDLFAGDAGSLNGFLSIQTATLVQKNPWFDNPEPEISDVNWEISLEPGVSGDLNLPGGSQLYGAYHYLYTASIGHDPAGLSLGGDAYPRTGLTELAYIGWRSKNAFDGLGENALDFSIGQQDYRIGSGFLLIDGAGDGGRRGAWWIGARTAFDNAIVGRINVGAIKAEGFHLETRPRQKQNKSAYDGANLEYRFNDSAYVGFSYIKINQDPFIKGTNVYDSRTEFKPLPDYLPGLSISAEYVFQDGKSDFQAEAGYAQISYQLADLPWQPKFFYRYTGLQYNFNSMAYGFTDWGTWYQGEIIGEHINAHSNQLSHLFRVQFKDNKVVLNLMYYYLLLDKGSKATPLRPGYTETITASHFGDEFNIMMDWNATERISISATAAAVIPGEAAIQYFGGGNTTWFQGMLYASFNF